MVVGKLDFTAVANESNSDNTVLDELNAKNIKFAISNLIGHKGQKNIIFEK